MTAREILVKARELIQKHGHATGKYEDESGRLCIVGACRKAIGAPAHDPGMAQAIQYWEALGKVKDAIRATGSDQGLYDFNDFGSEIKVLNVLEDAASR